MMNEIKAVIFDVDGVIFDTETMSAEFWIKTMAKYGYVMTEEIYSKVMGRNRKGIDSGLKEIYSDQDIDIEKIHREKTADMTYQLDNNPIPVLPGVFEIIEYLKKNGYKLGIATSTIQKRSEMRLKKEHLYDFFDAYAYGDQVKNSKPDPEIFLRVAKELGISPKEILVLEDSPSGVKAAFDGGFKCINVVGIKKPTEEIKKQTVAICNNLFEVIDYLEKNNTKKHEL